MSKDIRSFFQVKNPKKKVEEHDDDVIPESPDVHIKKPKKKKRVFEDDSDEEIFSKKKKQTNEPSSSKNSQKNKPTANTALKEVKVSDLFGNGQIKRTEPIVKKEKKKTETGIHDDDDFEKSLLEVDESEIIGQKEIKAEESQTKHNTESKPVKTPEAYNKFNGTELKTKGAAKVYPDMEVKEKIKDKKGNDEDTKDKKVKDKDTKDKKVKEKDARDNKVKGEDTKDKKVKEIDARDKKVNGKEERSETHKKVYEKEECSKIDKPVNNNEENTKSDIKVNVGEKKEKNETIDSTSKHRDQSKKDVISKKDNKKRDFTEFAGGDESFKEESKGTPKSKKKKLDKSLNESVLTDEERHERRMQAAALYKNYKNRPGPKHLGAKEIPEGKPGCLANCAFVLTGVLDSFEKDEVAAAITKYGGCVKSGVSKKVTHVLAGEDAGPAKMAKAEDLGIKIIKEDDFLQMIADSNNTKRPDAKHERKHEEKDKKHRPERNDRTEIKKEKTSSKKSRTPSKRSNSEEDKKSVVHQTDVKEPPQKSPTKLTDEPVDTVKQESKVQSTPKIEGVSMWVEKYKPQKLKDIIGQQGDAGNVKKLSNWLSKWYANRKLKHNRPSPWAKNDDGAYFKAALLSGPPGVGKTTTVALVCKELGFDVVEFNASDTRNKTLIKGQIGELLTSKSLAAYAKGSLGNQAVTKKHVLVMDEVDGMAGNEDRGGMQELISLIKNAAVPVVCMCNDRNSQKMRSLVNYCYDLRFSRPRVEQIKSAMLSICFKEGLKIPSDVVSQLISAANQDIRQTLNLLSVWAADDQRDADKLRKEAGGIRKDVKMGPWEAIRKVFSEEEHKTMSINDKSDLFFHDYSLAPLFVYENYLQIAPHCPRGEILDRLSKAADSISMGDLVDARIRGRQAWSLLPMQAMYSSVIPGHHLSGHVAGAIQFPGWLGKNSSANKMHRLCQEIHAHTRLSTSGSKSSIFLDYASHLRDAIVAPLLKEKGDGVEKSLAVLESYHLLREDLDSLVELSVWSGQRSPMVLLDSKVKAAMTRAYNKQALALPYAPGSIKKGRRDVNNDGEDQEEEEDEEDSDVEHDVMINKKKEEKPKAEATKKDSASTSKGKGKESAKDKPSTSKNKKK